MHVDLGQDGLGCADEPDPDPRREDLGHAVEADDPPDLGKLALEGEVRPRAGGLPEVKIVIGIV